eukprot:scpid60859/ scgid24091/ THAP domain-containing protein 2
MVNFCCVPKCHSRNTRDKVSFHRFPNPEQQVGLYKSWVQAIKREKFTAQSHTKICGKHFRLEDFVFKGLTGKRRLVPTAVPSLFPDWPTHLQPPASVQSSRRVLKRNGADCDLDETDVDNTCDLSNHDDGSGDGGVNDSAGEAIPEPPEPNKSACGAQNDHGGYAKVLVSSAPDSREAYIRELEQENEILRRKCLSLDMLRRSDDDTRHFTGFETYATFKCVFEYLEPLACRMKYWGDAPSRRPSLSARSNRRERKLELEEEFLAVIVRVRCGYRNRDVATFLGLSPTKFSRIFNTWICQCLMDDVLHDVCKFPSKESIADTLPPCFSAFPTIRIVIDCTLLREYHELIIKRLHLRNK